MSDPDSPGALVIPVIDLMGGVVVRGVAGERDSYQPIVSQLVDSANPLDVAIAFRERLGLERLYVADLDAIMHDRPDHRSLQELVDAGFQLLVDAGLRDTTRAGKLTDQGISRVIAGLETVDNPRLLESLVARVGSERLTFSLDLKNGIPLSDPAPWPEPTPRGIAETAIAMGLESLIVLDLAGVGRGTGLPTLPLCQQLQTLHPDVELITGGGIRHVEDIHAATSAGATAVLVASALHNGSLIPKKSLGSELESE